MYLTLPTYNSFKYLMTIYIMVKKLEILNAKLYRNEVMRHRQVR